MGELDSSSDSSSSSSMVSMSSVSRLSTLLLLSLALACLPPGQGYPYPAKRDNMANALQYLSQLDQSFSSHIRPRFGKRSYLHNLDTWADVLPPPRHLREDYMVRPSLLQK